MSEPNEISPQRNELFNRILDEYKRRRDAGQDINQQALMDAYPDLAERLKSWFAGESMIADYATDQHQTGPNAGSGITNPKARETVRPGALESDTAAGLASTDFGRYRLLRQLGEGAMGSIFLAHDTVLDRNIALKLPRLDSADRREFLARFTREAKAAAGLKHPNICSVYDAGEVRGIPYISMDLIDGVPLSRFVGTTQLQSLSVVLSIVRTVADALQHAHEKGIVHRDLKPGNVLMTAEFRPIVTDFGLARRISTKQESRMTQEGVLIGTPAYMAPEQVRGEQSRISPQSDIYSLGVVFFELLTCRLPFEGSVVEILAKVLRDAPPMVSRIRQDVPEEFDDVIHKMLRKEPERRYRSMAEVIEAIDKLSSAMQRTTPRDRSTERQKSPFEIQKQHLELMLQKGQYAAAIRDLEKLARETSPGSAAVAEWAKKKLPVAKAEARSLNPQGLASLLKAARELYSRSDYAGCIHLLDDVPELRRTDAMEELLEKARNCEAEIDQLQMEIRDKERRGDGSGLESLIRRLVKLKPGSTHAKRLSEALSTYGRFPGSRPPFRFRNGKLLPRSRFAFFEEWGVTIALSAIAIPLACFCMYSYATGYWNQEEKHTSDAIAADPGSESIPVVDSVPVPESEREPEGDAGDANREALNSAPQLISSPVDPLYVYLDDLPETSSVVHWGTLGKYGTAEFCSRRCPDVDGEKIRHSLFAHPANDALASVSYQLEGQYERFEATILNDSSRMLSFDVLADGKVIWGSSESLVNGHREQCDVDVAGIRELVLRTHCKGPSSEALGWWVNPRLKRTNPETAEQKESSRWLMTTSEIQPVVWEYIKSNTALPSTWVDQFRGPGDSNPVSGKGPFTDHSNPEFTTWDTEYIYLTAQFELGTDDLNKRILLREAHDDAAWVWINGKPVDFDYGRYRVSGLYGYVSGYSEVLLSKDVNQHLKPGKNTISIQARNNMQTRYIDLGLKLLSDKEASTIESRLNQNPRSSSALNDIAWHLATNPDSTRRHGKDAVAMAKVACAMTGYGNALYLDTLAAAYAETGDYDSAVEWQKKAVERTSEQKDDYQKRLDYFLSRHTVVEGSKIAITGLPVPIDEQYRYSNLIYECWLKLRKNPGSEELNNYAWYLSTCPVDRLRNGREALALGTKSCEQAQWQGSLNLGTLAAAHAECGDFSKAIEYLNKAESINPSIVKDIRAGMRQAFMQNKPYRLPVDNPPDRRKRSVGLTDPQTDALTIIKTAETGGHTWHYEVRDPGPASVWTVVPEEDPWEKGVPGFGANAPNVKTKWITESIYLRTRFFLPAIGDRKIVLRCAHDDSVTIYVNGKHLKHLPDYRGYENHVLNDSEMSAFRGSAWNTIAVHCRQRGAESRGKDPGNPQFIDVGLALR